MQMNRCRQELLWLGQLLVLVCTALCVEVVVGVEWGAEDGKTDFEVEMLESEIGIARR